jgi:hypothetical protein
VGLLRKFKRNFTYLNKGLDWGLEMDFVFESIFNVSFMYWICEK